MKFWTIGKTWLSVIGTIIASTWLLSQGMIDQATWSQTVMAAIAAGSARSIAEDFRKQEPKPTEEPK